MKRETNLIEQIADIDNLRMAFWKAKKGKSGNRQVLTFQKNLDTNLLQLRNEILTTEISIGNYNYFKVFDPKERQICAAAFNERVLHHALMNICHHNFEKFKIDDSYASRIGKGTYAALDRAIGFQKKYNWYLKLDVRKYFDSIHHQKLKALLQNRFKEKKLITLFELIIDSYKTSERKGLPIGNLTSQYFANHYLALSDHYIKEQLKCKAYVRYMDDMVLWDNSKEALLKKGKLLSDFIEQQLDLKLKPFCLNSASHALPFLGYKILKNKLQLNTNSRNRFTKKMKNYAYNLENQLWNQQDYQRHVLPLLAFVQHADSVGLRKKVIQQYG